MSAATKTPPGTPNSCCPAGFTLRNDHELIRAGDILADCEGRWRGPVPQDSDCVGRPVRRYTTSATEGIRPAAVAVARPL